MTPGFEVTHVIFVLVLFNVSVLFSKTRPHPWERMTAALTSLNPAIEVFTILIKY